jgi:hypothetical protein
MSWIKPFGMLGLVLLGLGRAFVTQAQPPEEWHLEKDKDGIRVYSRHLTSSRLKEIKVNCEMAGYPAQLVAFFSDVDQYHQVIYKNKTARLLRRVSETELYYYAESELPWPAANRDFVIRLRFAYDPTAKVLQINTNAVADMVPPQAGIVRVSFWQAVWLVRPRRTTGCRSTTHFRLIPAENYPPGSLT